MARIDSRKRGCAKQIIKTTDDDRTVWRKRPDAVVQVRRPKRAAQMRWKLPISSSKVRIPAERQPRKVCNGNLEYTSATAWIRLSKAARLGTSGPLRRPLHEKQSDRPTQNGQRRKKPHSVFRFAAKLAASTARRQFGPLSSARLQRSLAGLPRSVRLTLFSRLTWNAPLHTISACEDDHEQVSPFSALRRPSARRSSPSRANRLH